MDIIYALDNQRTTGPGNIYLCTMMYLVPTPFPSGGAGSRVGYMIIELQFQVVAHSSKTFQYPLLNVHLTKIDPLLVYVLLTYPPRSCGGDDLKKVKV